MSYTAKLEKTDKIDHISIIDKKFKTNTWEIRFIMEMNKVSPTEMALASGCITAVNAVYDSIAKMNSYLNKLYGANIYSSVSKKGDLYFFYIGCSAICDEYALEGEELSREITDLLLSCIEEPLLKDGGFDPSIFEIKKKDLRDTINAELNDKRKYLFIKAYKEMFAGEPAAVPVYGEAADLEKTDAVKAYKEYRKFIENAKVQFFYVGPEADEEINSRILSRISAFNKNSAEIISHTAPIFKKEELRKTESLDILQSKFLLSYKSALDNRYVMRMLGFILGGMPTSKLFRNIREKMSLCYYCACSYSYAKSVLVIDCGVEKQNIEKAIAAIKKEIKSIVDGDISDEEYESAIKMMTNQIRSIGDIPESYIAWFSDSICNEGKLIFPEEVLERYRSVTKEEIRDSAASLVPDTTYILESIN